MRLIDRYLFRQLLGPTLLATLALSAVAMLAEALSALGVVLTQRQSLSTFSKVILLAMPQLIVLILPIAVLVGGLIAVNRLQRDNEITICFASGMSRWQVISPAIRLSAIIATFSLLITLWIQPLCYRALRDTLVGVRTDLVASLIRPGQFTHPAPGVTVYATSVDEDGTIHNLFIDRRLEHGRDTTILAREGRLQRHGVAPLLILHHGANQELSTTGVLNFLSFDNYILDLSPLVAAKPAMRYKLSDQYIHELISPDTEQAVDGATPTPNVAEAHSRFSAPLYNLSFMALSLSAVLGSGFSRLGYGVRIAVVAMVALVTRVLGFAIQNASVGWPTANLLQYGTPILIALVAARLLFTNTASSGRHHRATQATG